MPKKDENMLKKNSFFIIILIFIFIFINNIFAYTITSINITNNYANNASTIQTITGVLSDTTGITDNKFLLNIKSLKDTTGKDFNAIVSGNNFSANFKLDLTSSQSSYDQYGAPIIIVNAFDTVTVSDTDGQSKSDTIKIDTLKPNVGTINSISNVTGTKYNDFYSKTISLNVTPATDGNTFIDKQIVYVVPIATVNNYLTAYTKKIVDTNISTAININSVTLNIPDGNYYVLLDANDIAGNLVSSASVLNTKKVVYFDNNAPTYQTPNLGAITASKIYVNNSSDFNLSIPVLDSCGIDSSSPQTIFSVRLPNTQLVLGNYQLPNNRFFIDLIGSWQTNDTFVVSLDAKDNLDNILNLDFNVIIDRTSPTIPNITTLTIANDKNVTIGWSAATDSLSGLKEYKVYRATSTFTPVTNQTLICTVLSSATRTCIDTTSKPSNTRLYYGVSAIDNAGNKSDVNAQYVHTGPSCSIEIADGNKYTNSSTPQMSLEFSDDVNLFSFSCNNSTFTSYIDIDDDDYVFNIVSGSGCNSTQGEKTIYFRVKSEDDPYYTTTCSDKIIYDVTAPTIPANFAASSQSNGSIKLTWASSDDNLSDDIFYKVYYSESDNVTKNSLYIETDDLQTIFNPNKQATFYFKIAAMDEAGNESNLSTGTSAQARRIGPSFTLNIVPSNKINDVLYVGKGLKNINFVSDQDLSAEPVITLKIGNTSRILSSIRTGRIISTTFDFNTTADAQISISGRNTNNETAENIFLFVVDSQLPTFDVNLVEDNQKLNFSAKNFSDDLFRIQYLLNDNEEICIVEKTQSANFTCLFDTINYSDGNYVMFIYAYDKALNVTKKEMSLVIDNIDEEKENSVLLKELLLSKIQEIEEKIIILEELLVVIPEDTKLRLQEIKDKKEIGDMYFEQDKFIDSNKTYTEAHEMLLTLDTTFPEEKQIKNTSFNTIYDANKFSIVSKYISDANILADTQKLYADGVISVDKNFFVQQIGISKYFAVTLSIKNNSDKEQTITIIEDIPKTFAGDVSELIFSKKVDILLRDPIVSYSYKIPPKSNVTLNYKNKKVVTDVDIATKYSRIIFTDPVILNGVVISEDIKITKPLDTRLLIYLVIGMVVLLILLVVIGSIIKSNKEKDMKNIVKPNANTMMNDYFSKPTEDKTNLSEDMKSNDKNKEDKFKQDYDYILNAIKKR